MSTAETIKATGRRKTATTAVTIKPGTGIITVNGRDFEDYFTTSGMKIEARKSLEVVDGLKKYDIVARASGGGLHGQAGALKLGIARALLKVNPEFKKTLREHGLLTRDPRAKERKKSGQPGARRRFQFSKR